MIGMLNPGRVFGIGSERRLCEEVPLNLACRWFGRLGLSDPVPDHSTFSKNRHGRFRDSDLFGHVFENVVARCIAEGLFGGQTCASDASLVGAEANKQGAEDTAEVGATQRVIARTRDRYGLIPDRLAANMACGSGEMLGWWERALSRRPAVETEQIGPIFSLSTQAP